MNARTTRWTTDLLVVLLLTALAAAVVLLGVSGSPLRTAAVAPLLLFLPGYALVAVVYPERLRRTDAREADDRTVAPPGVVDEGLSPAARVGLSVAASIALVPGTALAVSVATGGIDAVTTLLVLAPLTVVLTLLALARRARLPTEDRMGVPPATTLFAAATRPFRLHERSLSQSPTLEPTSWRGLAMNVLVVAGVLALVSSVGVASVLPQGQEFTEFYLVTQGEDGEYVANDYPRQFSQGGSKPLFAAVSNHEGEERTYTLVAELQRVDRTPNGTRVVEETELTRVTRTVAPGDTVHVRHDLRPTFGGGRLRVQYLLYRGEPPQEPTRENAYRSVHLWITVTGDS